MSSANIRLNQINLVVADMAASRTFYGRLGLEFGHAHDPNWADHHLTAARPEDDGAALDFDLDSTSFANKWNSGWPGGAGVVLGFSVPTRQTVDDLVAELTAAGSAVQQAPYDAFWGARYAIVSDPDGNAVGIMSPLDDTLRSEPPTPS